jgi:ABC-2 type transport system permease protein/lipopolysaccharide transport system permease protein
VQGGGNWTGYAPLDATNRIRLQAALGDISEGVRRWRSWTYLAVESVKNQYRRTVLGPWWLSLQTALWIVGVGAIFGQILHTGLRSFLPYVAVGFIVFQLISGLTRAGANVFVAAASTMKSTLQPLTSLVLREVAVAFIQFAHNMVLYLVLLTATLVPVSPKMLIAIPVVVLVAINGLFVGLWLGITVARFRDVGPLVDSILQVLVFFTPIFYHTSSLTSGARVAFIGWNPFTYLVNAIREPLIGAPLTETTFVGAGVVTTVNVVLGLVVFARARSRLPYWAS